jgi:TfoX/Sxy family transcriptional regulator of competence genes
MTKQELHPWLVPIAAAFAGDRAVVAKKMFRSISLTVGGKIFALVDRKGRFVLKLPPDRVDSLVGSGATRWNASGKVLKEWVALTEETREAWLPLAREARDFVGGATRPPASARRAKARSPSRAPKRSGSARR